MAQHRILMVEDNELVLRTSMRVIERHGFSAAGANCAEDALSLLEKQSFDLLLVDIKMPGMSGLEMLRTARERDPQIAALIITGYGTMETVIEAMELGALGFVTKPVSPETLVKEVEHALERQRLYRENAWLRALLPVMQASNILATGPQLDHVFDLILHTILTESKADSAHLLLLNEDSLELILAASVGSTGTLREDYRRRLGAGVEGWVAQHGQPVMALDQNETAPFVRRELLEHGAAAMLCLPVIASAKVIGVTTIIKRMPRSTFTLVDMELVKILAGQIGVATENARLFTELDQASDKLKQETSELEKATQNLQKAYLDIARTLVLTLEARDLYTRGHTDRVTWLSRQIALQLALPPQEIQGIEQAARFHDVGKIAVSDRILLKPGPLTPTERAELERHPSRGVELLRFLDFLQDSLPYIEHHHERYDGTGYPAGLSSEDIPLGARIIAIADAYDAMTSDRPYRPALSHSTALDVITSGAGKAWDPSVAQAFFAVVDRVDHLPGPPTA